LADLQRDRGVVVSLQGLRLFIKAQISKRAASGATVGLSTAVVLKEAVQMATSLTQGQVFGAAPAARHEDKTATGPGDQNQTPIQAQPIAPNAEPKTSDEVGRGAEPWLPNKKPRVDLSGALSAIEEANKPKNIFAKKPK